MKKLLFFCWYLGVVLATVMLVIGFVSKSWVFSILSLILSFLLKKTNKWITLPHVYQELNVKNEVFEGKNNI
ncbi:hypothetical protein [Tepidanaerobacter syntrophicus]|uniref:hypothetical protein n=1 Tax=Tepidanaerobacter syntrophicus TaxID=224999 RepID=UPI001BD1DD12|nr:hypothetical protein [Tepidanaerobacter syntrophicus]